ncbi:hypothetical protein AAC387_Pa01g2801 [Persea americana]
MSSADGNPIPVTKEIDHIRDSVADLNTRVTELTDAILRIQETLANRPPPHQFQALVNRRSSIKAPPLRTLPPLLPLPSASQPQLAPSPKFAPPATQTASKSFSMPTGVRRLSLTAQRERREKGLCFNCDEQFRPGHSWRPVIAQKLSLVWTTKTPLPWKLL